MLQYPSILGSAKSPRNLPCIAFEKYDGSNLRWEWSPKKGWNKFGTRTHLFDETSTPYNQAIPLFMDQLADEIVYRTTQVVKKPERITAFTEFLGPSSFAGFHDEAEAKELKLFDVFLFKKGFLSPEQFIEVYGSLPQSARVVYTGILDDKFIADVRAGTYGVFEGVVAKGDGYMAKIKTAKYLELLHQKYKHNWAEFAE